MNMLIYANIRDTCTSRCSFTMFHPEVRGKTFHFVYTGIKGDWPFLRKFMNLQPGFTSIRKCHYCTQDISIARSFCQIFTQDWTQFGPRGCLHNWHPEGERMPWKRKKSLMLQVPGADSPLRIKTDLAHTWAIGIGKEFCGAALLSMCDMNLFHGSLPNKLDQAYDAFRDWCYQNHESCKINEFSFRVLKIPSILGILNSIRTSMEPQKLYCVLDLDCFHHCNPPTQEKPIPKASRTGPRLHCCSQMDFSFLGRRHAGRCSSLKRSMFTLCACNTCHMHAFQS